MFLHLLLIAFCCGYRTNILNRRFSGDESFSAPVTAKGAALDAGTGLGVIIEGNKPKERTLSASSASRL